MPNERDFHQENQNLLLENKEKGGIAGLLKKYPIIMQFVKFVVIGFINTALDFAILNLEMWMFSIYAGWPIIIFNVVSFAIASTNSFIWNRLWTFKVKSGEKVAMQYLQFIIVTAIGMGINSSIVYLGTTVVGPHFGLHPQLWANVVKVFATCISLIWNFFGYKFVVFKKKELGIRN